MRIEIAIPDGDPVVAAIRDIPPGERAAGLRAIIRKHTHGIPALLGLAHHAGQAIPEATPPALPAAPAARAVSALAQPPAPALSPEERAALARRLVLRAAHTASAVALAGLLTLGFPMQQAHAGTLDLNINVASVNTEACARRALNQVNPGAGLTYRWSRTWALAGGVYRGSYRKPVYYAQAEWTPLHMGRAGGWHLDAGAMVGIATYTRSEVPCAPFAAPALVRITAPDGIGANVVMVPNQGPRSTGFVGLQLSIALR